MGPEPEPEPEAAGRPTELASASRALAAAGLRLQWLGEGPPTSRALPHHELPLSPSEQPFLVIGLWLACATPTVSSLAVNNSTLPGGHLAVELSRG